jgi:hypothetical protein
VNGSSKKITTILFAVSFVLIAISYILYNFVSVGHTDCGSACSGWLGQIFPIGSCIAVCVPQNIPHPLNTPLLWAGSILLIVALIYLFKYYSTPSNALKK